MRVKRTKHAMFSYSSSDWLKLVADCKGDSPIIKRIIGLSMLSGVEMLLSKEELSVFEHLCEIEWTRLTDLPENDLVRKSLNRLIENGFAYTDAADESLGAAWRIAEEKFDLSGWKSISAACHFSNRWRDMHLVLGEYGKLDELGNIAENPKDPRSILAQLPKAPTHFFRRDDAVRTLSLPNKTSPSSDVENLLVARRTRRAFNSTPLSLEKLSSILRLTFGYVGTCELLPTLTVIRKTSPAGGCLHSTECYPLIINVEGVDPGLYHYNVEAHTLDLLRRYDKVGAADVAQVIGCGQYFLRTAGVCFLLATRFERLHWKYRDHSRAYSVAWLDIGHLSQTCYLVSGQEGVGAAFFAAISEHNANELLGIDGVSQTAMAGVCCGNVDEELTPNLEKEFVPRRA